jgi:hypothetical protein
MPLQNFTEQEMQVLREVIRANLSTRQNPPIAKTSDDLGAQSPEVYVALPPSGGIPGLTRVGTDTDPDPAAGDTPGSATCDIYKLKKDGTLTIAFKDRKIYNFAETSVNFDWILVTRDKFGTWWAIVGAGEDEEILGTGTGTGTLESCVVIPGVDFSDVDLVTTLTHVLGISGGCLVKIAVTACP